MRILKEGKIPKYVMTCVHCGTEFEYQKSEMSLSGNSGKFYSLNCPFCDIGLTFIEKEIVEVKND